MTDTNKYKRYTITSALPYTNGPVHIGQVSGAYLPADIYTRYLRLRHGKDNVVYICGSDEHGVPITLKARNEGITPQDVVDKYHAIIKKSFEEFGISFDIYHRTSDPLHHETAAEFFKTLYDKGTFTEKESQQFYDEENKQFLADRYIVGTCPNCSNDKAYGDQCEKCGSTLSPEELINPKSAISGNEPVMKSTKHWYFPLDKCEDWLREWTEKGTLDGEQHHNVKEWKKHVLGQCKSWIDGGLHPRAMTRDLDWGVKVPVPGAEGKVLYVWFDAPIGYISATKAWAAENGKDWKLFWKDKESKLVHFIGKDNIVFHTIIFPAMLKEEGSYILPDNVPSNQFMNMEGEKMSTSRNWTVWLNEYLEEFPGKQDVLRYCLLMNMPENKDSDFSWKDYQARNNNELVANLGNLVNRVLVLSHKYFDGVVQAFNPENEQDKEIFNSIGKTYNAVAEKIEGYSFKQAINEVMLLSSLGNKYLADNEPWKLIKTDEKRTGEILSVVTQLVANLSHLLRPFLPFTADKIAELLNFNDGTDWNNQNWPKDENVFFLSEGHQLNKASLLFEKVEDTVIQAQLDKLAATKAANEAASKPVEYTALKDIIQYDDFVKLDIRTGTILEATKVPKSNKLLQLTIDLGLEKRTILSGIAKHFDAEEIIGQQVCVLANLAPRKMMGIESNGMVLMAEDADGRLDFVVPKDGVKNGMGIS